jgi:cobalt-zinc-cadmium efflux system outer membrane protein
MLLTWPLEAFLTMPRRLKIARSRVDAVAASVVQTSLDLTRDVRLAHVEWVLADQRQAVRRDMADDLRALAEIASARAAEGDVPAREADAAEADALAAADEAGRAEIDRTIARARLSALMGWTAGDSTEPVAPEPPTTTPSRAELERIAEASRPDLHAARVEVEAARARVGAERRAVVRVSAVGQSSTQAGATEVNVGPQIVLPIFDQNQGGIARARGELDAAVWRRRALEDRVREEVVVAEARLRQASRSLQTWRETLVAARRRELDAATAEYRLGEQTYVPVLLAANRLQTAELRAVELAAEVWRAHAELERAVGRRLDPTPPLQPTPEREP